MKRVLAFLFVIALSGFAVASQLQSKKEFVYNLPTDVNLSNSIDHWENLTAASTATVLTTTAISTTTLVSTGATYTLAGLGITDVIFPRNLLVDAYLPDGEATTTVTGSLVIAGYNQFGKSTSETIAVSTNAATGVVAWSTITSLTFSGFVISGASTDTVSLSVGQGNKIALSNNVQESGDMVKVIEAGTTSTTYVVNTTYDTIDFASDPNASNDYYVYYLNRTNNERYKY